MEQPTHFPLAPPHCSFNSIALWPHHNLTDHVYALDAPLVTLMATTTHLFSTCFIA